MNGLWLWPGHRGFDLHRIGILEKLFLDNLEDMHRENFCPRRISYLHHYKRNSNILREVLLLSCNSFKIKIFQWMLNRNLLLQQQLLSELQRQLCGQHSETTMTALGKHITRSICQTSSTPTQEQQKQHLRHSDNTTTTTNNNWGQLSNINEVTAAIHWG